MLFSMVHPLPQRFLSPNHTWREESGPDTVTVSSWAHCGPLLPMFMGPAQQSGLPALTQLPAIRSNTLEVRSRQPTTMERNVGC